MSRCESGLDKYYAAPSLIERLKPYTRQAWRAVNKLNPKMPLVIAGATICTMIAVGSYSFTSAEFVEEESKPVMVQAPPKRIYKTIPITSPQKERFEKVDIAARTVSLDTLLPSAAVLDYRVSKPLTKKQLRKLISGMLLLQLGFLL